MTALITNAIHTGGGADCVQDWRRAFFVLVVEQATCSKRRHYAMGRFYGPSAHVSNSFFTNRLYFFAGETMPLMALRTTGKRSDDREYIRPSAKPYRYRHRRLSVRYSPKNIGGANCVKLWYPLSPGGVMIYRKLPLIS